MAQHEPYVVLTLVQAGRVRCRPKGIMAEGQVSQVPLWDGEVGTLPLLPTHHEALCPLLLQLLLPGPRQVGLQFPISGPRQVGRVAETTWLPFGEGEDCQGP